MLMPTLTEQWSLQKFGETLISSIRFGLLRKLENNIQPILDLNIPVILGGDLNIDMLGNQCGHIEDILTRLNLENVVWEPTRITHTSATCINLFITNRPNLILDIKVFSLSNRLPYRAIHKRFIIWSNNYSFCRYVFITCLI
jgi:hypothetical protein